jgi:hypothetical protein
VVEWAAGWAAEWIEWAPIEWAVQIEWVPPAPARRIEWIVTHLRSGRRHHLRRARRLRWGARVDRRVLPVVVSVDRRVNRPVHVSRASR